MGAQVCMGDFLSKSQDWVEPKADQTYQQITVRLWGKGLILRTEVSGSQIAATRQLRVKTGQFLLSRIDARHGACGLVPVSLDGALVSNDFPCFDIDSKVIHPVFFAWYARTENFIALCRRASEGSTNRVRLKEDEFLRMPIHLPSLDEQQRIVAKLDKVAALVVERSKVIDAAERDAKAMLSNAFRQIIDGAPYRPMAEVAPLVRRPVEIEPDQSYPELGVRSFGRGTFHKPALDGLAVGSKKLFRIQAGDLLFNIVFAWEGAVAVAQPEDDGRVGSHRFLTCVHDLNTATADFLRFYFLTPEGLSKLGDASPGGAGRNRTLGLKKLEAIIVPVPSLDRQRWFDRLQGQVRQVEGLRESAEEDTESLLPAMLDGVFNGEKRTLASNPEGNENAAVKRPGTFRPDRQI